MRNSSSPELTFRGMFLGAFLTIIFTASNVYLGLKVGLTFASSIPAVVIAVAVLGFFKDSNILENNMVQTQVSAAGTLSAVIFVIPGLFIVGYWTSFPLWQTFFICFCGGVLGILFTIPLRKTMVVKSNLAYPEGQAAAEILKVIEHKNISKIGLKELSLSGIISGVVGFLSGGFRILAQETTISFYWNKMAFSLSSGYSLALLGGGYLVGLVASIALFVGIFLSWGIFVPYFSSFELLNGKSAAELASSLWVGKVRLIGAGVIAVAALWILIKLFKPVYEGVKSSLKNSKLKDISNQDLSFKTIMILFAIIFIVLFALFFSFVYQADLTLKYQIVFAFVSTIMAVLIGFFVAATCGYMAGLIGSSSSPISGIGIIAIILTSLVILMIGSLDSIFTNPLILKFATALAIFTTSVILATAAISNDNLQDLKTGQLVGATPYKQQIALIIGVVFGSLTIAPVLDLLYQAYGFVGAMPNSHIDPTQALAAPQANLMATLATGIFQNNIHWEYIGFGIFVGAVIIYIDIFLRKFTAQCALPPLAVGIGIYLPPSVSTPIIIGGILSYFIKKRLRKKCTQEDLQTKEQRGILFASGLIIGESLLGVIVAGITVLSISYGGSENPLSLGIDNNWGALIVFVLVLVIFARRVLKS